MTKTRNNATRPLPAGLGRKDLLELYRYMRLTRSLEERLAVLFRQSKLVGGLFRSLGQEGESVATAYALRRRRDGTGDMLSPLIRNLGSMLVMGATPLEVLRQYMAKGTSPTGGKELNIHFSDYQRGFLGQISPLGTMVPVMAGVTLSFRQRRQHRVGMVYIGDGATSTGAFHEGINLAAVQRCPLVVVVESNGYAYSTPTRVQTAARSLVDKASGYGVAGERVDGNDVLATHAAAGRAVERARSGEGVTLLEVETYRRLGHAQHDDQRYQPRDEIERWANTNDPIERFVATVRENGWIEAQELRRIDEGVAREINEAVTEAQRGTLPPPEQALTGVYAGMSAAVPWTRLPSPDPRQA